MGRQKDYKKKNKAANTGVSYQTLEKVTPETKGQEVYLKRMNERIDILDDGDRNAENKDKSHYNQDDVLIGCPGTGKTFLALTRAFKILSEREFVNKIFIVRSAETGQNVGFLPGELSDKKEPFEIGVKKIVNDIMERGEAYDILTKNKVIEFTLPTHLRSLTMSNSVVIVDEIQNLTEDLLETIYTRGGDESYVILCGDYIQSDIKDKSKKNDVLSFLRNLYKMEKYRPDFYIFGINDIMRHERIKEYLIKKYGSRYSNVYDEFREGAKYSG